MFIDSIKYNATNKSFLKIFLDIYENIFFKKDFSLAAKFFYFFQFFFFFVLLIIDLTNFFKNLSPKNINIYISLSVYFIIFFSKASDQTYTILTFLMAYNLSLYSNFLLKRI
jgi:hypothetical protein